MARFIELTLVQDDGKDGVKMLFAVEHIRWVWGVQHDVDHSQDTVRDVTCLNFAGESHRCVAESYEQVKRLLEG